MSAKKAKQPKERRCKNPACGKVLEQRKKRESRDTHAKRSYCSPECGYTYRTHTTLSTIPDRKCPACNTLLVRRPNERVTAFSHRRTCGPKCAHVAMRSIVIVPNRKCLGCGKLLVQRLEEVNVSFAARKNCDRTCGHVACRTAIVPGRKCLACNKLLVRRPEESFYSFAQRTMCDRRCKASAQRTVVVIPNRSCLGCGKLLVQHPEESRGTFVARKTCSVACWNSTHNRNVLGVRLSTVELAALLNLSVRGVRRRYKTNRGDILNSVRIPTRKKSA